MTRREKTGKRDLTFSQWVRDNLPDSSTGFRVTDLDFVFFNEETNTLMLMETKQNGAEVRHFQSRLFYIIDALLSVGSKVVIPGVGRIKYLGFHTLRFENKGFDDGKAWFDGKEITADLFKQMIEEKFQKHDERSI